MNHEKYKIVLPKPPSVNALYSTDWRTKRRFKSPKYKAWLAEAEVALCTQKRQEFKGEVIVKISVGKQNKRREDISNRIKGVEDFLVSQGIIEDDSKVMYISAWWEKTISGCVVSIGQADE
ncbi:MAG: RusA family crossover junction endodeoxyribonuclease [Candidatus Omnitrophica bacterium]|nr:RusA family crossover junction endodeoxyribonuclease [Candidatus Omnitrophota bacterium]